MNVKREDNCFDFLRLLAAFSVVIPHAVEHLEMPFLWYRPGTQDWFFDGVGLFFIISGFLVYRSCVRCVETGRPIRHYFYNRFLRIAPAIYVYVIITSILLLLLGVIQIKQVVSVPFIAWLGSTFALFPVYSPELLKHFGVGVVNGSLWTISAEFSFYFIIPLLVLFARRFGNKILFILLSAATILGSFIFWEMSLHEETMLFKFYKVSCFPYLMFFGMGIFWYYMWDKVKQHLGLAVTAIFLYAIIKYELLIPSGSLGPFFKIIYSIPLSYAVIWFGYNAPSIFSKITRRIGDLSYGIYIWHMVVINTLIYIQFKSHVIVLVTSFILAICSWWIVERPMLRLKPFTTHINANNDLKTKSLSNSKTSVV